MADEIASTEEQETIQTQPTETPEGSPPVHPAELRKAQKLAKEQAKKIADLQAKLTAREQADMSETEKLRARLSELDPVAEKAAALEAWANERVTSALAAMPKEAREKLEQVIEGLSAPKAMSLIEAARAMAGDPVRAADVPRGAPKQPGRTPTIAQIEANPELINQLNAEQRSALLRDAGLPINAGKVWGK